MVIRPVCLLSLAALVLSACHRAEIKETTPVDEQLSQSLAGAACLLVAPLENHTNSFDGGAEAADAVIAAWHRKLLVPVPLRTEYEALFLEAGIDPVATMDEDAAVAAAGVLGVPFVMHGSVEGRWVNDQADGEAKLVKRADLETLLRLIRVADGAVVWETRFTHDPELSEYLRKFYAESVTLALAELGDGSLEKDAVKRACWDADLGARLAEAAASGQTAQEEAEAAKQKAAADEKARQAALAKGKAAAEAKAKQEAAAKAAAAKAAADKKALQDAIAGLKKKWQPLATDLVHKNKVALKGVVKPKGKKPAMKKLKTLGKVLAAIPRLKVEITVHVGAKKPKPKHQALTEKQAKAIAQHLVKKYKVEASRITAKGMGTSKPVVAGADKKAIKLNTRVEVRGL